MIQFRTDRSSMSRVHGRDLTGRPIADAVDTVVSGSDAERETVRHTLDRVLEDGVVTAAAFEDTVGQTAKVLATAETRAELARTALEEARTTAEPVTEVSLVRTRLDSLAATVDSVEEDLAAVQRTLGSVMGRDDGVPYEAVRDLREVHEEATGVQHRADEVQVALEEFETWVNNEDERAATLRGDVDDLATAVDALEGAAEDVAADGDAATWADAAMQHASLALLVADLRAELDTLRSWPVATDGNPDWDAVAGRLDTLEDRVTDVAETLERACQPAWQDRYGASVDAVQQVLADREPPVDWAAVHSVLDVHRPAGATT
jgi:tetrahydromethanopterin S-methyltransferase subunit G